ncbi:unnamed protein product [Rotaria sp. Silwood1]|nr:unnamed protein product [Rotaria sp. Silwood1]
MKMCQFFGVNCLSFVLGLSVTRKEGYLQEQSINYYFDYHAFLRASYFCDLFDHDFQISSDIQNIDYDDDIKIINSQCILLIKCRKVHNYNEWTKHLSNLTEQVKDVVNKTRNQSDSYAPIRENQLAH